MKKLLFLIALLSNVGLAQTQLIIYSHGNVNPGNTAMYAPFAGGGTPSTTESAVATPMVIAGTVSNLSVNIPVAPGAGVAYVFTLRNRANNLSLTCSIIGAQTSCTDTVHSAVAAIGDTLDWQVMAGGTVTGVSNVTIVSQFTPSAFPSGLVFLCQASTPVASLSIGPCVIPNPPAGTQWRKIIEVAYVSAYGSPGDTVGDRYNGDVGSNYRFECNTMAAGGTTFAVGTNTGTAQTVLKMAPADSNLNRNILAIINNDPGRTEKTVQVLTLTGTNSVSSQAAFDLCNGAWISGPNVAINSVTQVTLTANMGANSGFALFGIAW